ncbi:MAG: diacylglycerol kinase family protein [Anaerolineae bacterium]|jgi:diacylglycerol kinase (ATP)|nr:diacylglycerol kinase family protein [Anaerolineae bacterium]
MKSLQCFFKSRLHAFRCAFDGLFHVLRSQPNAWFHTTATVCVILMGAWFGLSKTEWAFIIVAIGAVWAAEIANTAVEAVVDLVSPQPHPLAKTAKDCAAAMVLVVSGMAAAIGLLVMGPSLWSRLNF